MADLGTESLGAHGRPRPGPESDGNCGPGAECAVTCAHLSLRSARINRPRQEMGRAQIENNGAFCTKGVGGRGVQRAGRARSAGPRPAAARPARLMKAGRLLDPRLQEGLMTFQVELGSKTYLDDAGEHFGRNDANVPS